VRWVSRLWVSIPATTPSGWTLWHMCFTTLKSLWCALDRWTSCTSRSCLLGAMQWWPLHAIPGTIRRTRSSATSLRWTEDSSGRPSSGLTPTLKRRMSNLRPLISGSALVGGMDATIRSTSMASYALVPKLAGMTSSSGRLPSSRKATSLTVTPMTRLTSLSARPGRTAQPVSSIQSQGRSTRLPSQ